MQDWPSLNSSRAIAVAGLLIFVILAPSAGTSGAEIEAPAMVTLQSHPFQYRLAGDFTRDGKPVNAPARMVRLDGALTIMTHQVTAAEYQRCVLDHGCLAVPSLAGAFDRPAVKISWRDATAYAAWLSRRLGATYRLPTDEEWVFAAGSRFRDEALPDGTVDRAEAWLRRYEIEADRDEAMASYLRPVGSFGANEYGLLDFAGNVWEWTNTCLVHYDSISIDDRASIVNCGVRVVEGQHRTYMTDFIRDPRFGGCAVGKPPNNLGFRLVRESSPWEWLPWLVARFHAARFPE